MPIRSYSRRPVLPYNPGGICECVEGGRAHDKGRISGDVPMTEDAGGRAAIRVLIVDDHDLFRTGLASLLRSQPDIDVVAQASGGRMGVRLAVELQPDVVLMDLRMPDLDGPDATRQILARHPDMRVLVLTVALGNSDVEAALSAGACGFVAKDTPIDTVAVAVRAASQGAAWLSPRAAELVLGRVRTQTTQQDAGPGGLDGLSSRELDVLRLIALGKENAEIADALKISPRTAKNHVSNILSKLGLPGRVQAAIYAVRRGLV
jgi:two-component system, NarL family, response regulator LiaR